MKTLRILVIAALLLVTSQVFAQVAYDTQDDHGGRYMLVMFKGTGGNYGRSSLVSKTPALVLDTYLGIIWRCLNLQEERPIWVKTDLAKLPAQSPAVRRYTVKILEWPSTEAKMPAIVMDMQEAKVWTCPNILEETARWEAKDLIQDIKSEGYHF